MTEPATEPANRVDLLTVAGIACVAEVLSTVLHEAGGHGGACLAVGGKAVELGAYYFNCNTDGLPEAAGRIVAAAGSTVNLAVCLILGPMVAARVKARAPVGAGTLFLWLMFAVNAFTWAGYYMFSGIAGIGDWGPDGVLKGVAHPWLWRGVEAVGGIALYVWLTRLSMGWLGQMAGTFGAARSVAWTAYLTGGVVAILVGLLNPLGLIIVLISSAASSLGGTSGLAWGIRWAKGDGHAWSLPRNWAWIAMGLVTVGIYAWILGPTYVF
ncbi:hypothetical protein [Asticcacaulis sp. 201]|uniref:hypothetical protein n=1 Tax=Asticcacaulis sp. 201 TaxID=3028787 RepID=UPI0029161520|nr:hypothetical protein [Asticcacaulis sp. 201]MDV6330045.1 hypothetical protein [Asticcacaulis sp. 201]